MNDTFLWGRWARDQGERWRSVLLGAGWAPGWVAAVALEMEVQVGGEGEGVGLVWML